MTGTSFGGQRRNRKTFNILPSSNGRRAKMSGDEKKIKCDEEKSQKRKLDAGSDAVKSANDWEHVDLGDDSRKNKFLRLMGASKKEHHGKIVIGEKTSSHGRSKEEAEKLSEDLEEQYKQGLEMKLSGHTRKHVGLGFQDDNDDDGGNGSSGNNLSSSSKKNDDDDDEDHRPPGQRHRHRKTSRDSNKKRDQNTQDDDTSNNDNNKINKSRDNKEDRKKSKDDSESSSKKGDRDETGKTKDNEKSEGKSTTAKKFGLFVKAGDL
ncbi:hypothetical protein HELRODRAFT_193668 [Helobdella robusta]|uniref:Small acidic protein n=1 Tax=Helobdella robusta TaxID=6412 RepID=T1FV88_HELRO|nr:hypothetical protein HELRODRAFT_193668 [Helobdella robusta]ESN94952.1 hypothetical protein HELRODRAFT_193668 [Helobdella robusta]